MTDKIQKSIDDLTNETKHRSLAAKVSSLRAKIEARKNHSNHVLLCDVSGSMTAQVQGVDGKSTAIDIVQSVVDHFNGANIYAFHSQCEKVNGTDLGRPRGGTAMHLAFEMMHLHNHKEVTILTDGQPDYPDGTLKAAQGLKLNIIYIGPPPTPLFLEQLAHSTGGKFDTVELINSSAGVEVLENKIKGFLGA